MSRIHGAVAVGFAAWLLFPMRAEACSCVGGIPACQSVWSADAVFSGEVLSIDPVPNALGEQFLADRRVRFRVIEAWRGGIAGTVDLTTGSGGGDCGYTFVRGQTYLVYANAHGGRLRTGICDRTRPLSEAAEDLTYLKTALKPSAGGYIFGTVQYQRQWENDTLTQARLISGYAVALSDGKRTWKTLTDQSGRYEFTGIAAGKYIVTLTTRDREDAYGPQTVTLADPRGCAAANFYVVPDGRIRVRVVDYTAAPLANLPIELFAFDAVSADRPRSPVRTLQTNADGIVEFDHMPPKRYALAINGRGAPSAKSPYARSFFPGAGSLEEARAIDLAEGERIDLQTWTLSQALIERRVSGEVLWPDGQPARKTSVFVMGARGGPWAGWPVEGGHAMTGDDGRFTLTLHEGISYELRASVDVGQPPVQWNARQELTVNRTTEPLRLHLEPPRDVRR